MIKLIPKAKNGWSRFEVQPDAEIQQNKAQNDYYRQKAAENDVTWNPLTWAKEAYYRWMGDPMLGGQPERRVMTGMAPDLGAGKVVKAAKTASNAAKTAKAAKAAKTATKSAKTKKAKKLSDTTQQGINKAKARRSEQANKDMQYRKESYYYPGGDKPHRDVTNINDVYEMPNLFNRDPRIVNFENGLYFSPAKKIK